MCAAAVILDPEKPIPGLNDSKKLSPKKREALYGLIVERAAAWAVAWADEREIDEYNILNATFLAMRRAVESWGSRRAACWWTATGTQVFQAACPR